jgi:urease accessory protein
MIDVSPGMLDGDHYEISVTLERDSHLVLTNQSFTKIHPSVSQESHLTATFHLEQHAVLEYFPEPTIPYAESRYNGIQRFHLNDGSTLFFAEILTPGRTHHEEKFSLTSFSSTVEILQNNSPIAWEHFYIQPSLHQIASMGAMENYTHSGTFWIIHQDADDRFLEKLRVLFSKVNESEILVAGSLLSKNNICVRMLGHNVWQIQTLIQTIWDSCREELMKLPPMQFRK